jgi:hypothetical protein
MNPKPADIMVENPIYRIVSSMVRIIAPGPREDIYERAAAELSKTRLKRQNRLKAAVEFASTS